MRFSQTLREDIIDHGGVQDGSGSAMAVCSNTGFDLVCLVIDYDLSLQHDAWTSFCNLQPNGHCPIALMSLN